MGDSVKLFQCIHGVIWQTCATCREKTEKEVKAELALAKEQQESKLKYDYQELPELDDMDDDRDYDLDDMRMGN